MADNPASQSASALPFSFDGPQVMKTFVDSTASGVSVRTFNQQTLKIHHHGQRSSSHPHRSEF